MNHGRLVAFDIGMRRVGVAVGETETGMMFPRPCIVRSAPGYRTLLAEMRRLIREEEPQFVVVGLPLKPDGTDGPMTLEARAVADRLQRSVDAEVVLFDERLSSFDAEERLKQAGITSFAAKSKLDSAAACVIGEGWMASGRSV
jgi:putative Holliday junction resolvase